MLDTLTSISIGSLQLGSGAFLLNLDLTSGSLADLKSRVIAALESPATTLGYTPGGGWFRCVPALRSPHQDARRPPIRDDTLLDGWTVTLSGTLQELSPQQFQRLLPTSSLASVGRLTTLTLASDLLPEHYLPQLCWVGDTVNGLVLIELTNVLNVGGVAFHFLDRGEGAVPFEFRAHGNGGEAPCRVLWLE